MTLQWHTKCYPRWEASFLQLHTRWTLMSSPLSSGSVAQSCLFATLWTETLQAPLSMGFLRQEYWSGLPFPPPEDLPDPGIRPRSLVSPALASRFFTTVSPRIFSFKNYLRNSPGGRVAKITSSSQCRGPEFDSCQGTRSHMPKLKIPPASTKT